MYIIYFYNYFTKLNKHLAISKLIYIVLLLEKFDNPPNIKIQIDIKNNFKIINTRSEQLTNVFLNT